MSRMLDEEESARQRKVVDGIPKTDSVTASHMPRVCGSCEFHKSKGNTNPGKIVPGQSGKCTRPEGPCNAVTQPEQRAQQPAIPEITPERGAELAQMQNAAVAMDTAMLDSYDILKSIGRIEGIEFTRRVGEVAIAQIFNDVRNSKQYKGLPYRDEKGITRHVGTFEEFCQAFLGKSYNRCLELSQNLHLLGSDLYESAERIGFRAKDYRTLKALPAEDQEVMKQALASESKEQVLDLLQDMAARHASEKAALTKTADGLTADLEARDKLMKAKAQQLDKAHIELEKLKSLPPDENERLRLEREAAAAERISKGEIKAEAAVNEFLAEVADVLAADGVSLPTQEYAANLVCYFAEQFAEFIAKYGIAVEFEGIVRPEWTRDQAAGGDA
ncbi:MAG: hypothetical protein AB7E47_02940 [Desulfovibrionaceae bacterium]